MVHGMVLFAKVNLLMLLLGRYCYWLLVQLFSFLPSRSYPWLDFGTC